MNGCEYVPPVLIRRDLLTNVCGVALTTVTDGGPTPKGGCFPAEERKDE